jgi:hypothetical protein
LRFVRSKNVWQIKHKTTWICLHGPSSPSTHFLELSAPFVRKHLFEKQFDVQTQSVRTRIEPG